MIAMALCVCAQTLTINECVRLALDHYPSIAQYGMLEKVEQFNLSNAAKAWLPQGSVSAQASWQNDVAQLPELLTDMMAHQGVDYPGMSKFQYRLGVDVNQQIWDGGRNSASRLTVQSAADVERRSLDVQLYDVQGRVEDLYFAILLFDARISSMDKSIALMDSTLMQVRSMFANGVAMRSDCDQIEARLLSLQQQRVQMVASLGSYQRMLEIFIGQPVDDCSLALPRENVDADPVHPQLRLFDARVKNLDAREAGIHASVRPQFGAFVSGYYGYPGYNMFKNMQSHEPSFNFMVGLRASWNFGALYTRRASLDKLRIERQRIEIDRQTFMFNTRIAENESMGQIEALRQLMQSDRRIVQLRQSVTRAAQSQLRNGVIDTTALLSKITDEELAENDLALHQIELIKAIYQLNHIRNK